MMMLAALLLLAVVARLVIYRQPGGALAIEWPHREFLPYRATAVVLGVLVGSALATSGALLQTLLRNPLASPFVLGISSGSALGVMVALYIGWLGGRSAGHMSIMVHAIAGGLGALFIVLALARRRRGLDPITLLLTGVVLSSICSAGVMLLQHMVPHGLRGDLVTWLAGTIPQGLDRSVLIVGVCVIGAGVLSSWRLAPALDVLHLDDDEARTTGVPVRRVRTIVVLLSGVLAAVAVALCGPIAFIGLLAPHLTRRIVGARHGALLAGAAMTGAALLVGADALAQVVSARGTRLPVGVFMALLGGPAFLVLLRGQWGSR